MMERVVYRGSQKDFLYFIVKNLHPQLFDINKYYSAISKIVDKRMERTYNQN